MLQKINFNLSTDKKIYSQVLVPIQISTQKKEVKMISKIQATPQSNLQIKSRAISAPLPYLSKAGSDSVSFGKKIEPIHKSEFKALSKRVSDLFTTLEQKYSTSDVLEKNGIQIGTTATKFTPKIKMTLLDGNLAELSGNKYFQQLVIADEKHAAPAMQYEISPVGIVKKQELAPKAVPSRLENEEESLAIQAYLGQILGKFSL